MDKNIMLVSAGILFKDTSGGHKFLLVKEPDSDKWEFVKVPVRKGESSVRAIIRILGEKGMMTVRVLEEAGRYKSVNTTNGKTVAQSNLYYIMILKSPSQGAKAFGEVVWLEYGKAVRKLSSKKEISMLKSAQVIIKEWKKKRKKRRLQEAEEEAES